jgi:hypothetical protein
VTATSSAAAQPRIRPTFSTLQQHYSPAKSTAPKPLTATYLAPPSPSKLPANVAASAEASRLQAELLQLHLLHRDAAAVNEQWRASARDKLGQRFAYLGAASSDVAAQERAEVEADSVLALRSWAPTVGAALSSLEDRIQGLDSIISSLWTLTEPGGRYARLVRRFERWLDQLSELEEARRVGTAASFLTSGQSVFVGDLDGSWKEDHTSAVRRLDGWRRQLREIGGPPEADDADAMSRSNLGRMLSGSQELVHTVLAELSLMEEMEQEALLREDEWVERMNRDENGDDTPRAGAIWRIY